MIRAWPMPLLDAGVLHRDAVDDDAGGEKEHFGHGYTDEVREPDARIH